MANQLAWTFGVNEVAVPTKGTITQQRAIIRRAVVRAGISIEGKTDAEVARIALRLMLKYLLDLSVDQQRDEGLAAQRAQLEAAIAAENDLFDDPSDED